jgi:hypothetical protein
MIDWYALVWIYRGSNPRSTTLDSSMFPLHHWCLPDWNLDILSYGATCLTADNRFSELTLCDSNESCCSYYHHLIAWLIDWFIVLYATFSNISYIIVSKGYMRWEGLVWLSELGSWITNNQQPTTHTSLSPIRRGFAPGHFQQYFSHIMASCFSGGKCRSTRWEPPTMGKQLVSLVNCDCESTRFVRVA